MLILVSLRTSLEWVEDLVFDELKVMKFKMVKASEGSLRDLMNNDIL